MAKFSIRTQGAKKYNGEHTHAITTTLGQSRVNDTVALSVVVATISQTMDGFESLEYGDGHEFFADAPLEDPFDRRRELIHVLAAEGLIGSGIAPIDDPLTNVFQLLGAEIVDVDSTASFDKRTDGSLDAVSRVRVMAEVDFGKLGVTSDQFSDTRGRVGHNLKWLCIQFEVLSDQLMVPLPTRGRVMATEGVIAAANPYASLASWLMEEVAGAPNWSGSHEKSLSRLGGKQKS
ncbi:MAG: hypothetical protein R3E01_19740 [Pirellulaceae bacterium]